MAALAVLVGSPPAMAAKPRRIMSLTECTDLLLLMLVPRERIASITFLAGDAVRAIMPGADAGVAINHGAAEEVLRQRPDLIVAGTYTGAQARRLARLVGANLIELPPANGFADIRLAAQKLGAAVGEPARGEALVRRMDATLARLAASRLPQRTVIVWDGSGSVPGDGTLTGAIIGAAGARNLAGAALGQRYGSFDVEQLLAARPDAILRGHDGWNAPSLHQARGDNPLVRALWRGRRIAYPDPLYACGLPQSADAAVALRAALRALPAGAPLWR